MWLGRGPYTTTTTTNRRKYMVCKTVLWMLWPVAARQWCSLTTTNIVHCSGLALCGWTIRRSHYTGKERGSDRSSGRWWDLFRGWLGEHFVVTVYDGNMPTRAEKYIYVHTNIGRNGGIHTYAQTSTLLGKVMCFV